MGIIITGYYKIAKKKEVKRMKKAFVIVIALLISVVFASAGFAQEKAAPPVPAAPEKVAAPEKAPTEKKVKKSKKSKKPKKSKKSKKAPAEKAPEAAPAEQAK
jgi:cytochrome bd-type quinol oxidase subunit 1